MGNYFLDIYMVICHNKWVEYFLDIQYEMTGKKAALCNCKKIASLGCTLAPGLTDETFFPCSKYLLRVSFQQQKM